MIDNKQVVRDTYNQIAQQYFETYVDDQSDEVVFKQFADLVAKGKILDLGCGYGKVSQWFVQNGFDCVGFDISEEMIEFGLKNNPDLNLQCADITNIPLQYKKADGAIYAYSFFHLTKQQGECSLKSLNKNLKDQAYIMLMLQKGEGEEFCPEPFSPQLQNYIKYYTLQEITEMLNQCGFEVWEWFEQCKNDDGALGHEDLIVIAQKIQEM